MVHEPQTNGVIERFFKTLKLECLWIENFRDVEHAGNLNQLSLDGSYLLCMLDLSGEAEISSAEEQLIEE